MSSPLLSYKDMTGICARWCEAHDDLDALVSDLSRLENETPSANVRVAVDAVELDARKLLAALNGVVRGLEKLARVMEREVEQNA